MLKVDPLRSLSANARAESCSRNAGSDQAPHATAQRPIRLTTTRRKIRVKDFPNSSRRSYAVAISLVLAVQVVIAAPTVVTPERRQIDFVEHDAKQVVLDA